MPFNIGRAAFVITTLSRIQQPLIFLSTIRLTARRGTVPMESGCPYVSQPRSGIRLRLHQLAQPRV